MEVLLGVVVLVGIIFFLYKRGERKDAKLREQRGGAGGGKKEENDVV